MQTYGSSMTMPAKYIKHYKITCFKDLVGVMCYKKMSVALEPFTLEPSR